MSERKFKVGDRVRYKAFNEWAAMPDGFVGQIVEMDETGIPAVLWENGVRGRHAVGYLALISAATDNISPAHYGAGSDGIECIDAIKAQMTGEAFKGYLRGNIAKYVWRYEAKGGAESLEKAKWYLERLIAEVRADA